MTGLITWLKSRPVVAFLLLTLVVNYVLLLPLIFLQDNLEGPYASVLAFYAPQLAVYSPVLVAIVIVRWLNPERNPGSAAHRRIVFWVVWLVALGIFVLEAQHELNGAGIGSETLLVWSLPIALLPAYVISSALGRFTGVRDYLSSLIHLRGRPAWYLIALFTFPAIHLLGQLLTQLMTTKPVFAEIHLTSNILIEALIAFVFVFFYSGGINEEAGWRGYAQSRMQQKYSPLTTNLLLYLYLVVWHVPNDIFQYADGGYIRIRIILYPFIVILFGWVYNRAESSILAVALFHASMNSMNVLEEAIPATTASSAILALFATYAVVSDRMWQKFPTDPAISPRHSKRKPAVP